MPVLNPGIDPSISLSRTDRAGEIAQLVKDLSRKCEDQGLLPQNPCKKKLGTGVEWRWADPWDLLTSQSRGTRSSEFNILTKVGVSGPCGSLISAPSPLPPHSNPFVLACLPWQRIKLFPVQGLCTGLANMPPPHQKIKCDGHRKPLEDWLISSAPPSFSTSLFCLFHIIVQGHSQ